MTSLVFYTLLPTLVLPAVLSKATGAGRRAWLCVAVTSLVYAAVLAAAIRHTLYHMRSDMSQKTGLCDVLSA